MSDKRRKARVQGGWAPKRTKAISSTQTSARSTISETKEMQAQSNASHHLTFKPTIKVRSFSRISSLIFSFCMGDHLYLQAPL